MEGEYCHCDYCKCKHGYGEEGHGHKGCTKYHKKWLIDTINRELHHYYTLKVFS